MPILLTANAVPRIVVAIESSDLRRQIARMLLDQPWHVIGAADGMAAVKYVDAGTADLLLIESQMSGVDGLEVCRRVRRNGGHPLLPIVLVSSTDDSPSRVAALEAGADDVLAKPLERGELVARVRSMLRLKSERDRLEDARQVIFALAKAAEAKDLFTLQHAERVAENSGELAMALSMRPDEVAEIRAGALIHDVGKLVVPDYILNKPGPLTESEFALVKKHPLVGAEIVLPLLGQRHLFAIVRSHHERYDGTGYPAGVAGEAIPLAARIVAVCDAYDAMTNHRSYRSAMPAQKAIRTLLAGKGRQWDGQLVDALIGVLQR